MCCFTQWDIQLNVSFRHLEEVTVRMDMRGGLVNQAVSMDN